MDTRCVVHYLKFPPTVSGKTAGTLRTLPLLTIDTGNVILCVRSSAAWKLAVFDCH